MVTTPTTQREPVQRGAVAAGMAGHIVEWFDYAIYGFFATQIGAAFFPNDNAITSLLYTFAVFGVGFVMRPIGGIFFGHYGDKVGRRQALVVAVALMSVSTVAMGLIPSYASIGVIAPAILVLARLIQGFSAGGEWAGAGTFMVEHSPVGRRGLMGGLQQAGTGCGLFLGSLAATTVITLSSKEQLQSFGWRIPFLISAVLGLSALLLRLRATETPMFTEFKKSGRSVGAPIKVAFASHKKSMLLVALFTVSTQAGYYLFLVYFPSYAQTSLGFSERAASFCNTVGVLTYLLTVLVFSALSDRIGRKPVWFMHGVGLAVATIPLLMLLTEVRTFPVLLLVQVVGSFLEGLFSAVLVASVTEMFPTHVRYTAVSIPYNITAALVGGFAGYIVTALIRATGDPVAAGWFMVAAAVVSTVTFLFMRDNYRRELT